IHIDATADGGLLRPHFRLTIEQLSCTGVRVGGIETTARLAADDLLPSLSLRVWGAGIECFSPAVRFEEPLSLHTSMQLRLGALDLTASVGLELNDASLPVAARLQGPPQLQLGELAVHASGFPDFLVRTRARGPSMGEGGGGRERAGGRASQLSTAADA
ncbi:MAG: hypothetical protein SGPRY_004923, partial [Prymnesium sp.]